MKKKKKEKATQRMCLYLCYKKYLYFEISPEYLAIHFLHLTAGGLIEKLLVPGITPGSKGKTDKVPTS